MDTGLIHIYCGDGKGKTTASIGLAVRCAGRGGRIFFTQFLKERMTGELTVLSALPNVEIRRGTGTGKFTFQMNAEELAAAKVIQEKIFRTITERCREELPDLLVMDEILDACSIGLINERDVIQFLKTKPPGTEVVLTGRNPSQALIESADYVSEVKKIKHPYDRNISARIGIEE